MPFDLVAIIFTFVVMFLIGSILNILLKTTSKLDWSMTLLISLGLAIVFVGILNSN
ncbi:hypothetical protein [Jeotgalibacillus salarius]|uniref:hypothetical protein n=1 Tax=Jeotgalibacillus salarius TaxID=546023 RepID=UPI00141BAE2F|nr:hypothetical protein [Jeotgalibacillus salarius]